MIQLVDRQHLQQLMDLFLLLLPLLLFARCRSEDSPEQPKPSHTQYAILAPSGSGSTWINQLLATHPCISSMNELLMHDEYKLELRLFHSGEAAARLQLLTDRSVLIVGSGHGIRRSAVRPGLSLSRYMSTYILSLIHI